MSKKTLLIVLFLLAITFSVSCFDAERNKTSSLSNISDDNIDNSNTTETEVEKRFLMRFDNTNYDGYEFKVMCMDSGNNGTDRFLQEIFVESETGDVIDDAVVTRNRLVEEKLNIIMKPIGYSETVILKNAQTSIMAGENVFDIINIYKRDYNALISENLLRDWDEIPIWDHMQVWWNGKCYEDMRVKKHLFGMSGSMLISDIDDTIAAVFNKKIALDYNLNNLYDIIKNKTWTLDTMIEMVTQISDDLNGDGQYTEESDLFGYIEDPSSMTMNWIFSNNLKIGEVDEVGQYSITVDVDKVQNVLEKLYTMFSTKQYALTNIGLFEGLPYFEENRVFIYAIILRNVEALRGMDIDFGIIPYPMYDENQENYYTHVGVGSPVIQIPITNNDNDERLGTILEALAETSHEYVLPAYYDIALKTKISRDNESSEMLDILLSGRRYEFSYYYFFTKGGVENIIRQLIVDLKVDFTSSLSRSSEKITSGYQQFLDKIDV